MREAGARLERATLQGFEDNCVLSRTHLRNRAARHDRAAHRSSPAAKTLSTIVVLQHAAWCNCLVSIACSVCVCVCVCVCGRMHAITHTLGVHRRPPIAPPRAVTVEARHNHIRHITERNMGQSLYLCSGSAGFCCWGLGKGGTARITTQGQRGTFFRVVFRYLAFAALSFSGPLD
jgi:hypothetical protein